MSVTRLASVTAIVATSSAFATVTPTTLFGDAYIVQDGTGASARFYSVLDVYIKGSNASDIISSTFGVSAYTSAFTMNQGDGFVQTNGGATPTIGCATFARASTAEHASCPSRAGARIA